MEAALGIGDRQPARRGSGEYQQGEWRLRSPQRQVVLIRHTGSAGGLQTALRLRNIWDLSVWTVAVAFWQMCLAFSP
jgi:hypothetical protein